MTKDEMRRQVRAAYRASADADRSRWSASICSALLADTSLRSARVVMAFYPLPDEVDIRPVLDALCGDGKTVLLPQVVSDTEMRLRRYETAGALESGRFDILEPVAEVYEDLGSIDVIIVPGVAFDKAGHRLGRGKGYYDRFLQGLNAVKIGVCHPYQLLDSIPFEPHDALMDRVLSVG